MKKFLTDLLKTDFFKKNKNTKDLEASNNLKAENYLSEEESSNQEIDKISFIPVDKNYNKNSFQYFGNNIEELKNNSETKIEEVFVETTTNKRKYLKTPAILKKISSYHFKFKLKNKTIAIVAPLTIALIFSLTYFISQNNNDIPSDDLPNYDHNREYSQLYVGAENDRGEYLIIPITIKYDKKDSLEEEIEYIINLLKTDSILKNKGFETYLPKNAEIKSVSIANKKAILNFTPEFNEYEVEKANYLIQSLVWTLTQFEDINTVEIRVNEVILDKIGEIKLIDASRESIGINKFVENADDKFVNRKNVITFLETKINKEKFLVPITRVIEDTNDKINNVLHSLYKTIALKTGIYLPTILPAQNNLFDNSPEFEDETINFNLKESALLEENIIRKDLFEVLMLNFNYNKEFLNVNIYVYGEAALVDGVRYEDSRPVFKYEYNAVEI